MSITDGLNRKLLSMLQNGFPLIPEPFGKMGKSLMLSEAEVINRIEHFKREGVIRQISPILDARSLGYSTTLVAMKLAEARLERGAQILLENPYISHAYERDHSLNLWFTLAMPGTPSIEAETMWVNSWLRCRR